MTARSLSIPPGDEILGAFLFKLFLMLFREGVIDSRSVEVFYPFESNITYYCYSWGIDALGKNFKNEWNEKSVTCSPEWGGTHP